MKDRLFKTIKKYRNLVLAGVGVVLVALVLVLSLTVTNNKKVTEPDEQVSTTQVKFVLPVSNASIAKSYSATELQYNQTLDCWEVHKGLDILATTGDSVLACYDGKVSNIYTNYLEGTTIEITHDNGLVSVYKGLNAETAVEINDVVKVGNVIGTVASSLAIEAEDGTHVHFELIKDGEKVDPLNYIEISLKD